MPFPDPAAQKDWPLALLDAVARGARARTRRGEGDAQSGSVASVVDTSIFPGHFSMQIHAPPPPPLPSAEEEHALLVDEVATDASLCAVVDKVAAGVLT